MSTPTDRPGCVEVTYSQLADMISDYLQSNQAASQPVTDTHSLSVQQSQHMEAAAMARAIGYVFGPYMLNRYRQAFRFVHRLPMDANPGQAAIDLMAHMEGVDNG